jgi:hypothetical protein
MIKGGSNIHSQNVADAYTLNNNLQGPSPPAIGVIGPPMAKGIKKNV